jgi:hypothetical protein
VRGLGVGGEWGEWGWDGMGRGCLIVWGGGIERVREWRRRGRVFGSAEEGMVWRIRTLNMMVTARDFGVPAQRTCELGGG